MSATAANLGEPTRTPNQREQLAKAPQCNVAEPSYKWSEQRELNSRHRGGSPRHQPLYHARPLQLAGVTGFEPACTRFGDERPSHRVITPVAVATGVEPVPPDRQSGILPLDSATAFNFGCEGTIRTCMNRVRAGDPIQLNDLATFT